jgi:predicted MFS family arabinose efflux permease
MTAFSVVLLFPPPTTETLIVTGSLTGLAAALIIQPLLLALTERSDDSDRGSAFALFNAAFAASMALSTVGTAPVIGAVGFGTLLAVALGGLVLAALVAFLDSGLRHAVRSGAEAGVDVELATEAGTGIGP